MIVIYAWRTPRKRELGYQYTYWRGLFLLGIVPLAIWVTGKTWKV